MKPLPAIYAARRLTLSFELFPPKTDRGEEALFRHVERLVQFDPGFITCTYGAGGSTQDKTLRIAARVAADFQLPAATHLTCVGLGPEALKAYLQRAEQSGVGNVIALRGDPPQGETSFQPVAGGFSYANELVAMIHDAFPQMGIAVAAYPEVHQEALSADSDLENLKRKVDAGAHAAITQLFYDNDDFFRFRDRCDAVGLNVPLVPGLLPVTELRRVQRITSLCGSKLPAEFLSQLESAGDDADAQFQIGVDQATQQSQALVDAGVPGIHYYVMNQSEAVSRVLEAVAMPE